MRALYLPFALVTMLFLATPILRAARPAGAPETANKVAQAGGVLAGFVYESDGTTPIPGAQVCVEDFHTGDGFGCADTDPQGHFEFVDLPSGDYRVSAEANGFVSEFFDNAYGHHDAEPVHVTSPDQTNIDFQLELAGCISGRVTDGAAGIDNLNVYACDYYSGQWVAATNTDPDGNYTLFLPTGTYRIETCARCFSLPYVDEFYDDTRDHDSATPVDVDAPDCTEGIDFVLDPAGCVRGQVTDGTDPIPNLEVTATDYDTAQWAAGTITGGNGEYTLYLPTGTYRIWACASCSGLPHINEYYSDTCDHNAATPVEVVAPGCTEEIDFVLELGGSISGFVYSEDNMTPLQGIMVEAHGCDFACGNDARTDEVGFYRITGLPDGFFMVQANNSDFCNSGSGYVGEIYEDTHDSHQATCVEVTAPEETPDIHFYLASISLKPRPTTPEEAIADGLAWLARAQNADGSWGNAYQLAATGLSVLNLETYAHDHSELPLDPAYAYSTQVQNGLDFIFAHAAIQEIDAQWAGNPDVNNNGIAVFFELEGYETYNTSIDMMAIASSGDPDRVVNVPASAVDGWTYREVLEDVVEWIAWAQTDRGYGRGGWNYGPMNNEGDRSDQSNSGWASLGLAYAENDAPRGFEMSTPGFVGSELDVWINQTQNDEDGGSIYDPDPDRPENFGSNYLRTGNMLQQMAFVADAKTKPRVQAALNYLIADWDQGWSGGCPISYHTTYTLMKGFKAFEATKCEPEPWPPAPIDNWYKDFVKALLPQQTDEGSWPISDWDRDNGTLSTNWALLTLQEGAVEGTPKANLVVTKIDLPECAEGGQYYVQYTITNRGNCPSGPTLAGLAVDGIHVQQDPVPALPFGESHTGIFRDPVTISGESDHIVVCADYNDSEDENNEDDNCLTRAINICKPDLIVLKIDEEWLVECDSYIVHYTVMNKGKALAPAGHDVQLTVDHEIIEQEEISVDLPPGGTHTDEFSTVVILTDNLDEVEVLADCDGEVDESEEENNSLPKKIKCPPAPDLVVEKLTQEWVVWCQSYILRYEIRNAGNGVAAAGHDILLDIDNGRYQETVGVPDELSPGQTFGGDSALIFLTGGLDVATMCADIDHEIDEINEENNCLVNIITCPEKPDLRSDIGAVKWIEGHVNEEYTVDCNVRNFGNWMAEPGHWAQIIVDGVPGEAKEVLKILEPNEYDKLSFEPIEISGECDDITVCADVSGVVEESDEDNNCSPTVRWCKDGHPAHVALDIKPGGCPNPLNRKSKGKLPVAILGTEDVDVSTIDLTTIGLSRADGVGEAVDPLGSHLTIEDVGTPFEGELCDCHEQEGDGIDDLLMKFDTQKLVDTLKLEGVDPGEMVKLVVTGKLMNGTPFEASDCVRLVPPKAKTPKDPKNPKGGKQPK